MIQFQRMKANSKYFVGLLNVILSILTFPVSAAHRNDRTETFLIHLEHCAISERNRTFHKLRMFFIRIRYQYESQSQYWPRGQYEPKIQFNLDINLSLTINTNLEITEQIIEGNNIGDASKLLVTSDCPNQWEYQMKNMGVQQPTFLLQ